MSCKACAQLPAVQSEYTPKGKYLDIHGLKTYVTGPADATRGLVAIYDIFGLHASTLQGADRLVAHLPNTLVIVPDFFKGQTANPEDVPPNTEEKKKRFFGFMSGVANFQDNTPLLLQVVGAAKTTFPAVTSWGNYGLCWGGKLSALTAGPGTPFKVAGAAHPSRLVVEEAENLTIPFICLFSKEDGEPALVESYSQALQKNSSNYVEKYADMQHGWMAARANLTDARGAKEFERGYAKLAEFFAKHLT